MFVTLQHFVALVFGKSLVFCFFFIFSFNSEMFCRNKFRISNFLYIFIHIVGFQYRPARRIYFVFFFVSIISNFNILERKLQIDFVTILYCILMQNIYRILLTHSYELLALLFSHQNRFLALFDLAAHLILIII